MWLHIVMFVFRKYQKSWCTWRCSQRGSVSRASRKARARTWTSAAADLGMIWLAIKTWNQRWLGDFASKFASMLKVTWYYLTNTHTHTHARTHVHTHALTHARSHALRQIHRRTLKLITFIYYCLITIVQNNHKKRTCSTQRCRPEVLRYRALIVYVPLHRAI